MRVLGARRLSLDTDESVSVEVQGDSITYTTKARGDRLVHTTTDTDVSGAVSPFEREDLGPWLTDPDKIRQWDVLMVAKLDRLTRSLLDFQIIMQWCDAHGKTIVSVAEGFDLGTNWGRLIANILVMFAEFERKRIAERRSEAAEKLRTAGRWNGGRPPYGYMVKKDAAGAVLYQDPDTAPVVRWIVSEVTDSGNMSVVCDVLNDRQVPTPRNGKQWTPAVLSKILSSRYLLGELQYQGHTVRGDDGVPVMITDDPILKEDEWIRLQDALLAAARPHKGTHSKAHLLLHVAYCGECDAPMYYQSNGTTDRRYYRCSAYYRGPRHEIPAIRASILEGAVEDFLLGQYGDYVIEKRAGNGKDYAGELALAERELQELEQEYVAHNLSAVRFARMSTLLETRQEELRILMREAQGPRWETTGETVRQRWERFDAARRQAMLQRLGLRWYCRRVCRVGDRAWQWKFVSNWLPLDEAHERITR